jgi:hypothetical protein
MINFDKYVRLVDRSNVCEACLARDPQNPPTSWVYREFLAKEQSNKLVCHVIGLCNHHLNDQDALLKAGWEWISKEDLKLFRIALLMKS